MISRQLTTLEQEIRAGQQRFQALQQRADEIAATPELFVDEVLQELQVAYEELRVSEEALRAQIDELLQARHSVDAGRQRYERLFEFAADAYLVTTLDGRIEKANRAAAALLGVEQAHLIRKPLAVFVAPGERAAFRTRLREQGHSPRVDRWELHLVPRQGEPFPAEIAVQVAHDPRGEPQELLWVVRDLRPTREAEAQERETARERAARQVAESALTALRESEERHRLVVDEVQDHAILMLDPDGHVATWNAGAERILGWTEDEILGHSGDVIFTAEDQEAGVPERERQTARTDGRAVDERWHCRRDGTRFWASGSLTVLRDDGGELIGFSKVFRDRTAEKRSAEALSLLAGSSAELATSLDPQATLGRVAELAVPRLADWCLVDLIGEGGEVRRLAVAHADPAKVELLRGMDRLYPPTLDADWGVGKALRTGMPEFTPEVNDATLRAISRDADHLEMLRRLGIASYLSVPMTVRGRQVGAISLAVGSGRRRFDEQDLTLAEELARRAGIALDNAQLYETERAARAHAETATQARDDLLAMISHDLRNPLQAIIAYADLAQGASQREAANEAAAKPLQAIQRAATEMEELIERLLELSRAEGAPESLQRERLDPAALLESVTEVVRSLAGTRGIALELAPMHNLSPIFADRARLTQVFSNLVGNAVKFTPPGGRIMLVAEQTEPGSVTFSVWDTGPGIAPEDLPRLFDRFWQARHTRDAGAGLGLAIVKAIVEAHGGRVWAESQPGQGSTFLFTIPTVS